MIYQESFKETGEVRPPLQGEYFLNSRGFIEQARFDFYAQKFKIIRIRVEEVNKGKGRGR